MPQEVSEFLRQYLTVGLFAGAAAVLVVATLSLGKLIRPSRPQQQKYINYESGVDPVGSGAAQSQVRYYIFALLFVVFDVETVFMFPWALGLERYGTYGLVTMGAFIVILTLPLVYAWRKGVLRWI